MGEGRKKAKESRVVPHPKLNPGCATAGEGASNESGVLKMAIFASFARCIFQTFTSKATFIILCYVAPEWLFNDTKIDDLE